MSATSVPFTLRPARPSELDFDLLDRQRQTGPFFTGHLTRENYVLFGFDAAF